MGERVAISYEEWIDSDVPGWRPTPQALKEGLLVEQKVSVLMPDGSELFATRPMVTQKGIDLFRVENEKEGK